MTSRVDDFKTSGVPFIDGSHPVIRHFVDSICNDLANHKDQAHIVYMIDKLEEQVERYLISKYDCIQENACDHDPHLGEIQHRLDDLRNTFLDFGGNMAPATAATEVKTWADNHIFTKDQKCMDCGCKSSD